MPPSSRIRWVADRQTFGHLVWEARRESESGGAVTLLGRAHQTPDGWVAWRALDCQHVRCPDLRSAALWILEAGR
jgi:hypothetical protein